MGSLLKVKLFGLVLKNKSLIFHKKLN